MDYDKVTIRDGIKELAIFEKNQDAWVSSRTIAKMFDKDHDKIMRSIQEIVDIKDDFSSANFGVSNYKTERGKTYKEYLLNRKSFALVAMGFTGEKAMSFKKQYIEAFEAMNTCIHTRLLTKEGFKELTSAIKSKIGDSPQLYANELDMLNKLILGMTSKDFRELNDVQNGLATRDSVVQEKLDKLNRAQRLNAQLIMAGVVKPVRQDIIKANFK